MHPAMEGCAAAACMACVRMWGITFHVGCSQHQWNSCHPAYVSMVLQEAVRQARGAADQWGACTSADGDPEVGFTLCISALFKGLRWGSRPQLPRLNLFPDCRPLWGSHIPLGFVSIITAHASVGQGQMWVLHLTDCCGLLCRCMLPASAHCPLGRACSVGWPLQSPGMVC